MLYSEHESLFPRFAAPGVASHQCRSQSDPGCRAVCGLGGDHQTLPQTATRAWPCRAQDHPRSACYQGGRVAGSLAHPTLAHPIRGPFRRDTRRALFSKLKAFLRRQGAWMREALQEAIAPALTLITASDARGWFTHCGQPPPVLDQKEQQFYTPL